MLDEGRSLRDTLRLALVAVGRGGRGDVGQRIRDEILLVQSRNDAKVWLPLPPRARRTSTSGGSCLGALTSTLLFLQLSADCMAASGHTHCSSAAW
jgi:hypothetical protein